MNKNSWEYEKILSSLSKNFHESEKNSRQSEKISCKSEKFSHLNKNSWKYEKILSSLNKNFHESEKNSRESEKILASLKKFSPVWKNSREWKKIRANRKNSKFFMSRKNSSESMLSWCYDFDGCHKWYVNKNCHIFFKKNEDWKNLKSDKYMTKLWVISNTETGNIFSFMI